MSAKSLINRRQSTRYPDLFVKKYDRSVFFKGLWNEDPELLEARGHVETADGKVVIRPFTKIFNRFENGTDIALDETCVAIRKVNGFMAAATWVQEVGEVVVSTTGSLDSDYVTLAEKYIDEDVKNYIKSMMYTEPGTYLFEICDPSDPHIVDEVPGVWLIGFRPAWWQGPYFSTESHERYLDEIAAAMGPQVWRPMWNITSFESVVSAAQACCHEGYVVYGQQSQTALKIKSPYYLHLKLAARKKDVMSLDKTRVDEEYYPLIDHLKQMGDAFTNMDEQQRLAYMRKFLEAK